jgi:molybdopterin converting factor small subunit
MKVSVKLLGDFIFSVKNTKFEMEMEESLNIREAVDIIFEHMKNKGDILNLEDVIVALDGAVTDPSKWELTNLREGQIFTFFPPLTGG